jgi:phage terminase large subunit
MTSQVRELGSGKSRIETARGLGLVFEIAKAVPLEDGINATRMLLPRMWFNEATTQRWLDSLATYRWAENKALGEFRASPVHDWASHAADMTRYGAVSEHLLKSGRKPINMNTEGTHWMA